MFKAFSAIFGWRHSVHHTPFPRARKGRTTVSGRRGFDSPSSSASSGGGIVDSTVALDTSATPAVVCPPLDLEDVVIPPVATRRVRDKSQDIHPPVDNSTPPVTPASCDRESEPTCPHGVPPLSFEPLIVRPARTKLGVWWDRIFGQTDTEWLTALSQAVYSGAFNGEGGVEDVGFAVGFWTRVKSSIVGSHDTRHRTILRVAKLMRVLRPMLDELRCRLPPEDLTNVTPLGRRFVERAVKALLDEIEDDKLARMTDVRHYLLHGTVSTRATIQRIVCTLAPMLTDEDVLARRLGDIIGHQQVRL